MTRRGNDSAYHNRSNNEQERQHKQSHGDKREGAQAARRRSRRNPCPFLLDLFEFVRVVAVLLPLLKRPPAQQKLLDHLIFRQGWSLRARFVLQFHQAGKEFFRSGLCSRVEAFKPPGKGAVLVFRDLASREEIALRPRFVLLLLHHLTHYPGTSYTAACTPARPSVSAILDIASITKAICSSRSTPSSAAPLTRSSRLTPAAKPLVFIFLRTEETSRPRMLLFGRTSAVAVTMPVISSQA